VCASLLPNGNRLPESHRAGTPDQPLLGSELAGHAGTIQQVAKNAEVDLVIGCVDTRKARRAIDKWVLHSRVLYWLDLGNNASSGQFVLGQPKNRVNQKKKHRLPTVTSFSRRLPQPGERMTISRLAARQKL
jgi:hypothetical protein